MARLIGVECETLARWRTEARGPTSYRVSVGTARISYRFADLAVWMLEGRAAPISRVVIGHTTPRPITVIAMLAATKELVLDPDLKVYSTGN